MMRRRTFCRALALLPLGALLATCGKAGEPIPALPSDARDTLRDMGSSTTVAMLLASPWRRETPARLTAGYSIREFEPDGLTAVTVAFYPDLHRVSYAVCDTSDEAGMRYAAGTAAMRADPRGQAVSDGIDSYPTTTLFYGDAGHELLLVGPLLVRVIAAGSNLDYFTALVSASMAHLALTLAGNAKQQADTSHQYNAINRRRGIG